MDDPRRELYESRWVPAQLAAAQLVDAVAECDAITEREVVDRILAGDYTRETLHQLASIVHVALRLHADAAGLPVTEYLAALAFHDALAEE